MNGKLSKDHLEIHKIAYEQGLKKLEKQESTLNTVRTRATVFVTLNGLAVTFIGSRVVTFRMANDYSFWDWSFHSLLYKAAIITFIFSIYSAIQVMRTRNGWFFYFTPKKIISQFAEGDKATDLSITYKHLSFFLEENYNKNKKNLDYIIWWYTALINTTLVHTSFWIISSEFVNS